VTRRSLGCGLLLGVLGVATLAGAQPARPPATVGLLCVGDCPAPPLEVSLAIFLNALRETGYVDGQNLLLDLRGVGDTTEQLPVLATRLVRRRVDVIVAMGAGAVLAAKHASTMIPSSCLMCRTHSSWD
jgi:hypothetical protein